MHKTNPKLYDKVNHSVRIDMFEELSDQALVAVRTFAREIGAPHLVDEAILPMLKEGDSQIFVAVQDRPWPPWGLGARRILALCQVHQIVGESYALSPVYALEENLTNIGLTCAVYKEALAQLAVRPKAEVCYLVAEHSTLIDLVLRQAGFRKSEDIFLTSAARYYTYRASAEGLLKNLGLYDLAAPDLLAHEIKHPVLEKNALFHGSLYLAARPSWASLNAISEIIQLVRGGHAGKPGGVPGGTGQWTFDPERAVSVQFTNVLGEERRQQLLKFLIESEDKFTHATVVQPGASAPVVNEKLRRGRTLNQLEKFEDMIAKEIREHLEPALRKLNYKAFSMGRIEMQAAVSGDGDYFHLHPDSDDADTREITFVYYVHREPRRFSGGELRIFPARMKDGQMLRSDHSDTLSPRQDTMVFFPSLNQHEVLPVRVPSKEFADGRFSITGWIHRAK